MGNRVNVGTIGHIDHGRTTLTAALVKVLGEEMASQVVIVDDDPRARLLSDEIGFDGLLCGPNEPGKRPINKRKSERAARMKAAQLKAFLGGSHD